MADLTHETTTQNPVSDSRDKLDTLLAIPRYLNGFKLSPPSTAKAMIICNLTCEGLPVTMRVVDDLQSAKIPFEPSCFGGAAGDRKGCLMSIPQESADAFISMEEWAMQQLDVQVPNIKEIWVSSVRPSEKWPPTLRCKINVAGSKTVKYYNGNSERCDAPTDWRQLPVNAIIAIRGVFIQKGYAGMLLDITHLQYVDEADDDAPF